MSKPIFVPRYMLEQLIAEWKKTNRILIDMETELETINDLLKCIIKKGRGRK